MIEIGRGDVVFFGERGEHSGKLRPGVVVQRDATLADAPSVTLCGITSDAMPTNLARVPVMPSPDNGLDRPSYVMIDKLASISRKRVRQVFGKLTTDEMAAVDHALKIWLEL
jgi:mRNA interferase MazF